MPVFFAYEFAVLIFALALFVYYWAARPFLMAVGVGLAQAVRGFPAIGDDLADWILERTVDLEHLVQRALESAVHAGTQPAVDIMNGYANNKRWNDYYIRIVMSNIVGVLAHVSHAQQHQVTQPVVDTVNHTVTNNVENTNNYITQVVGVNQQYVDDSYNLLSSWANDAIQTVYQDVVVADTAINDTITWAEGEISKANEYAASTAEQALTDAVEQANQYTLDSFTTLEGYVAQTVDWVSATLTAEQAWTTDVVNKGISDVEGIAAGLTTLVITNVLPRVLELEKEAEDCLKPMCNNGPNFMRGLGSMSEFITLGALFGLLVEARTDPEGVAHAVAQEANDLISLPASVLNAVLGTNIGK